MRILALALALSACQHPDSVSGPNASELLASINANPEVSGMSDARAVRRIQCKAVAKQPTEFSCRYEVQDKKGAWIKRGAILTKEQSGWTILGSY